MGGSTSVNTTDDRPKLSTGRPYKTPLQIFSSELTNALRKKLPNLNNQQIQRIIVDKWCKLNVQQKLVYRNKALILSRGQQEGSPVIKKHGLPAGWSRSLVRVTTASGSKRLEIILTTPSGEKLRTPKELTEYTRSNNIFGVSPDIFDLKTIKSGNVSSESKSIAVSKAKLGGVVKEVLTTDNGMKMVRMVVQLSNGEKRETLVPAVTGADGSLQIALPRNVSLKSSTSTSLSEVPTDTALVSDKKPAELEVTQSSKND